MDQFNFLKQMNDSHESVQPVYSSWLISHPVSILSHPGKLVINGTSRFGSETGISCVLKTSQLYSASFYSQSPVRTTHVTSSADQTDFGPAPMIRVDGGSSAELDSRLPVIPSDMMPNQSEDMMNRFNGDGGPAECIPGEVLGCANPTTVQSCGDDGMSLVGTPCPDGLACRAGRCEASNCAEGFRICLDESTIGECARDEGGYVPVRACAPGSICQGRRL